MLCQGYNAHPRWPEAFASVTALSAAAGSFRTPFGADADPISGGDCARTVQHLNPDSAERVKPHSKPMRARCPARHYPNISILARWGLDSPQFSRIRVFAQFRAVEQLYSLILQGYSLLGILDHLRHYTCQTESRAKRALIDRSVVRGCFENRIRKISEGAKILRGLRLRAAPHPHQHADVARSQKRDAPASLQRAASLLLLTHDRSQRSQTRRPT